MRRREFLASSAAAALAATLAPRSSHAAPAGTPRRARDIRKALKYGMIGAGSSVLDKFRIARDAGFEGVEMDSPTDLDLDEVLRARDETGLVIPGVVDSVHWSRTLSDADPAVRDAGRAALETALRDCKALGGTSVLLVPAVVNKHVAYADAYTRSQAEIRRVLPLAADLGIAVAIENVWNNFLLSPIEAARYTDELDSPWIGWHLDPGNLVAFAWPEHWIRTLGRRILKLDCKDYSRRKQDEQGRWKGFEVEIGEGDTDWPACMRALDEVGYRGWLAAEVGGGDADRLRDIARRMDAIIAS